MPDALYLVRHGQSVFNAYYAEHQRDPLIRDAPLSELGRRQVAAARVTVARLPRPDVVISSPLTRAIDTGLGLFGPLGVPVEVSALLRERVEHSCDVGRSPRALAEQFPGLDFGHLDDPWWHAEGADEHGVAVEPEDAVLRRVEYFRRWVMRRPERTVAVVGHGTFFRHLSGRSFANCEIGRLNLADWTVVETF
jgi:glucosyl-3-phosphoglycerate phosphatase